MLTTKISNIFKKLFSRKYKTQPTYTDRILTKWDGTTMSRYTDRGRLTAKEMRWMNVYHTTGSDIRKRGIWRIAQKQVKAFFTAEQLEAHTVFNKSLSTVLKNESDAIIVTHWEDVLFTDCMKNRVAYPSVVVNITDDNSESDISTIPPLDKLPALLDDLQEEDLSELSKELDSTISELLGIDISKDENGFVQDDFFNDIKL